jgi:hypothetical protein
MVALAISVGHSWHRYKGESHPKNLNTGWTQKHGKFPENADPSLSGNQAICLATRFSTTVESMYMKLYF